MYTFAGGPAVAILAPVADPLAGVDLDDVSDAVPNSGGESSDGDALLIGDRSSDESDDPSGPPVPPHVGVPLNRQPRIGLIGYIYAMDRPDTHPIGRVTRWRGNTSVSCVKHRSHRCTWIEFSNERPSAEQAARWLIAGLDVDTKDEHALLIPTL